MHDDCLSPIPSLRKSDFGISVTSIGNETMNLGKFPPSFRIARNFGNGRSQLRYRSQRGNYLKFFALCLFFIYF